MKHLKLIVFPVMALTLGLACKETKKNTDQEKTVSGEKLQFQARTIADSVSFLWAHDPVDLNGDGIADLLFVDTNHSGGQLGFYVGRTDSGVWQKKIIDPKGSAQRQFAMGDIEAADMDNDGDMDVVVAQHQGEWKAASEPSKIYWYENPGWKARYVGIAPNFIKDISIADFNQDQEKEIVALTFEQSSLTIFQKSKGEEWSVIQQYKDFKNLHEGMDVGDVNGDGFSDIVAEGHIFYSPGRDLGDTWPIENIDSKWNTQTGDWSRNGTKVFLRDLDGDKKSEVFISHSERPGYPLSVYKKSENHWQETQISDSIPACHTLQVFDFNKDGNFDVLAGMNKTRAADLGFKTFPVTIFLGNQNHSEWTPHIILEDGIYNGQVVDYDGDGDFDIFRYQTHDATSYELLENKLIE